MTPSIPVEPEEQRWEPIMGYPDYAVSDDGRVMNVRTRKMLKAEKTLTRLSRPRTMSEKAIHAAVIEHWKRFRLPNTLVATMANEYAHGQPGLTPGIFDLLVMTPKVGAAFLELKTDKGKLSEHQESFKLACLAANVEYAVAYGRDQPIQVLENWGAVRRAKS